MPLYVNISIRQAPSCKVQHDFWDIFLWGCIISKFWPTLLLSILTAHWLSRSGMTIFGVEVGTSFTSVGRKQNNRKFYSVQKKKKMSYTYSLFHNLEMCFNTILKYNNTHPVTLTHLHHTSDWQEIRKNRRTRGKCTASNSNRIINITGKINLIIEKCLTPNASNDQDLLRAAVSHGPLRYFHQHGEQRLL